MNRDVDNRRSKSFLPQLFSVVVILSLLIVEGIAGILILHKPLPHMQSRLLLYLLPVLLLMPLVRCLWGFKTIKRQVIVGDIQGVSDGLRYVFASICAVAYAVIIAVIIAVR